MKSAVWEKYAARHGVPDADRDMAAELIEGAAHQARLACAAMLDAAAASCRTNGTGIDSYELQRLAERMRNQDNGTL